MAEVQYAGDTLFLSRFGDRWRVLAAASTPRGGDEPHDCTIKGG